MVTHTPERFVQFMAKTRVDDHGCWIWTAGRKPNGYGHFRLWQEPGGAYAHRWAYEHFIGPIPDGLHIDHTCNRGREGCVNPRHLEAVTQAENNRRQRERLGYRDGQCRQGHIGDLYIRPDGAVGYCRVCRRERRRRS